MRGLLRFANRTALAISIALMVIGAALAWLTYRLSGRPALLNVELADVARVALSTLLIALLLIPLRTALLLQQSMMEGFRHVVTAQIPEPVVQPVLFLALIGGVYLIGSDLVSPQGAMILQVVASVIALGLSAELLRRAVPRRARSAMAVFETRRWLSSAVPFMMSKGMNVLNQQMDIIMLGMMDSATAVALYAVTQRGTQLITLLLTSVNTALAPNIADLYAGSRRDQLQRVMTHSARLISLGAVPFIVVFALWGRQFLGLFGPEFVRAYPALIILSAGQFVNAATGSVGLLLMMTDREQEAVFANGLTVALHFAANLALISWWGVAGAAVGGALSAIISNLIMVWFAWRRLGIHTTALGDLSRWRIGR